MKIVVTIKHKSGNLLRTLLHVAPIQIVLIRSAARFTHIFVLQLCFVLELHDTRISLYVRPNVYTVYREAISTIFTRYLCSRKQYIQRSRSKENKTTISQIVFHLHIVCICNNNSHEFIRNTVEKRLLTLAGTPSTQRYVPSSTFAHLVTWAPPSIKSNPWKHKQVETPHKHVGTHSFSADLDNKQ